MMAEVRFSPAALQAYHGLEKAASEQMFDAIDDAVDLVEAGSVVSSLPQALVP